MTPRLDRARLAELHDRERAHFRAAHPRSAELAAAGTAHLLAGVPMAWMRRWPGDFPLFVAEAVQGRVRDVDGIDYIDLCLGDTGAMAGHAVPSVTATIADRANRGATTMLPTEDAAWVAGELARRFGVPAWQFALSATDANRFALRIARAVTGRQRILVFDWCYHGTVDETLVVLDPTGRVVPRDGSLGAPVDPAATTAVVPFNDVDALATALRGEDIACVLAEPVMTNVGIVLPDPGFHDALRRLTRETGTLLVIDETHTICAGPGGYTGAHGLDPDLLVIGKAIGGGVPAAAYGLSAEVAAAVRRALHRRDDRRERHRRHTRRQRTVGGCDARRARGDVARGRLRGGDPAGRALRRRGDAGDRRAWARLARAATRLPGRVLVRPSGP